MNDGRRIEIHCTYSILVSNYILLNILNDKL